MCTEGKAPIQNDAKEMWSIVNSNLLVAIEEGTLRNSIIEPSWKGTYLTFASVQILKKYFFKMFCFYWSVYRNI